MTTKRCIILLILVGALVYAFNLKNALFWDDIEWIAMNPNVHSFSAEHMKGWFTGNVLEGIGLASNYYRPFLFATFTLNYAVHQMHPAGWHVVSNLIHIANGILLFFILMRLFKDSFVAFWTSMFFLLHPVQTEAVSYISGRGDPLGALFMFLALLWFVQAEQGNVPWRNWRRWASLLALVFALLSRETAIMFPFLVAIVWVAFLSKKMFWPSVRSVFLKVWPYFGVVVSYGILRLTVLNFDNTLNFFSASASSAYTEHVMVRMYTFLSILMGYARLLIIPLGQHMDRNPAVYTSLTFWQVWVPLLVVLGCIGAIAYCYRAKKASASVLFLGFAWFFAAISPMSGITPVNGLMYEHWLYLPLIGPFAVIMYYLSSMAYRKAIVVFLVAVSVWFSYLSIQQNILWGDHIRFFENILAYEPASARTLNNLGNLYFDQNNYPQAEVYFRRAVETNTVFPQAYYNLARLYRDQGKYAEAIPLLKRAVSLDAKFFYAYQELAIIYAYQGKFQESYDALISLKELQPNDPRVYLNLAKIEQARRRNDLAAEWLRQGIPLSGHDPEALQEMQALLDAMQKKR